MRTRVALSIVPAAFAFSMLASCLGATEILLDIHTNVPCTGKASWQGVAIYTGDPGLDVETKAPATTTLSCDASGNIGTLAIVPSGAKDGEVGIRVVAGVSRAPEDCASHDYDGCIVARRTINFIPHQTLDLRIDLTSDCLGEGCDALHSCVDGACDDARVNSTSNGDAGVSGPVRCGDDGVTCPTEGNLCCLTIDADAGVSHGRCVDPKTCLDPDRVLGCDTDTECNTDATASDPIVCCMINAVKIGSSDAVSDFSSTACIDVEQCGNIDSAATEAVVMCEDKLPCLGTKACAMTDPTTLPGLHACAFAP